ncbi:hypothetical protein [Nannocystis pusilla]|uniref:hypothetical protein n=1 Tax=Nannocystis pusilla TaxID=889268 RepID=UPI003B7C3C1B
MIAPVARAIRAELFVRTPDVAGANPGEARFWDPLFAADAGGWELGRPRRRWWHGSRNMSRRACRRSSPAAAAGTRRACWRRSRRR